MARTSCPHCPPANSRPRSVRLGRFYRKSDGQWIQRYRCLDCRSGFSSATPHPCYRQNKRHLNELLRRLFCSGISQRRVAQVLNINRKTVVRKFLFLAMEARRKNAKFLSRLPKVTTVEFDDMETFEHSKCKPLSITLAVEFKSRKILGFEVSRMPAKGLLAAKARKKYGKRPDERKQARRRLFARLRDRVLPFAEFKSDQNPHYPEDLKEFFPQCLHSTTKGRRGCVVGQGELKGGGFDPLFTLNHTCAMLRADINRLVRRTWSTTKKIERLADHLSIYVNFHNQRMN